MATREDPSSKPKVPQVRSAAEWRSQDRGRVLVAAVLTCLMGNAVHAQFAVQSVGLQVQARPNCTVNGRIRLSSAAEDIGCVVTLKVAELAKDKDYLWQPADPNEANEPNYPPPFRAGSCRKWITLDATRQLIHSMNPTEMVPVYIQVPQGLTGLYRAAIVVRVWPHAAPVQTQYDVVLPVLLEVKDEGELAAALPKEYMAELGIEGVKLHMDVSSSDPSHTFVGSRKAGTRTSLESRLTVTSAEGVSAAGGKWTASIADGMVSVAVREFKSDRFVGSTMDGKDVDTLIIGRVTIQVTPVPRAWPFVWPDL
jgi:hypothetical protein